jgi:hypothetical protein
MAACWPTHDMPGELVCHPTDGVSPIKLVRTRSGNLQASGLMSNETALGALAMALLVFQGECRCKPRPVKGTWPSAQTRKPRKRAANAAHRAQQNFSMT